jgi:hypothetical protein
MTDERLRGDPDAITATIPTPDRVKTYGKRYQSQEPKGPGFFGELARTDEPDMYSGELSISSDLRDEKGNKVLYPLLVPTLSREEIAHLVDGGDPTKSILRKAREHAIQRLNDGKSPFAGFGEQVPLPDSAKQDLLKGFQSK